ncbi:MAG: IPT/TIG domain-containing protein [Acidobacteriota bacterium]
MRNIRYRALFFALMALMLVFAGCKGESPTSPTPSVGNPGTPGGTPPPTGAAVVLTSSNPTPLVSSTSVITATVTSNGTTVPNGTAVEFSTNLGTFTDSAAQTTVRTTTNGVATVTLTAATVGTATVTAVVNSVSQKIQIAFQSTPVTPVPPSTTPTLLSVTPAIGRPQGGETITISGTNFRSPARVIFDFGGGKTKDAFIVSVTPTQIVAITPSVDLTTGQQQVASISVIVEAGTSTEQKVSLASAFTFQSDILTPAITAVSPASGPIDGGTRVTIFGDGFQAPVQVFFGAAEAQVVSVNFKQLIVMSPTARDTAADGSGAVTGPVGIKVTNINSNKTVTLAAAFRYTPKMQITAAGPTEGLYTGGTRVQIDGIGFNDPVAVSIGGVAAQPISVSGTRVIAITSGVQPASCSDVTGPIIVTNVDNGDFATGPNFIYRVPKPIIVGVTGSGAPGSSVNITVFNAGAFPQLTLGGTGSTISAVTQNSDGSTTFQTIVPGTLTLGSQACPAGGSIPIPTSFDVVFTSGATTCTTTLPKGLTVQPANVGKIFVTPNPLNLSATAATAGSVGPPVVPPTPAVAGNGAFTIVNNGAGPFTITAVTNSNPAKFVVTPPPPGTTLQPCDSTVVNVTYPAEASGATSSATVTITATSGSSTISATETVVGTTK